MANAKLHIICGNCGCASMFEWRYDPQGADVTGLDTSGYHCDKCGAYEPRGGDAMELGAHGCGGRWHWKEQEVDNNPRFAPTVTLSCRNCSTLHNLDDNAKHSSANNQRCHGVAVDIRES